MISPDTKPGTLVGCIQAVRTFEEACPHVKPQHWDLLWKVMQDGECESPNVHDVLTVDRIDIADGAVTGFSVSFEEWPGDKFPLGCFRVLQLPRCLTSLLVEAPDDVTREDVSMAFVGYLKRGNRPSAGKKILEEYGTMSIRGAHPRKWRALITAFNDA